MKNVQLSKKNKTMIIIAVILVVVISGIFLFINLQGDKKLEDFKNDIALEEGGQNRPEESSGDEEYKIDLISTLVFDLDDINFRFAIIKIRVQSIEEKGINLSLNHFQTSEGIYLDQVDSYVQRLEEQSYFLGKQNVWFEILSNEPTAIVNLFVPIKDGSLTEIGIKTDLQSEKNMKVSLSNPQGTSDLLQYEAEDIITDGKTYQMVVSTAYEITGDMMTEKSGDTESEYLLPSTTAVYAFNIQMVSLWGDTVVIEKAQYIPDGSTEIFEALDSSIQSMKYENIIDKEIAEKGTGDLFFVAYNPQESPVSYKGVLKLKVKGDENWIVIRVDLN